MLGLYGDVMYQFNYQFLDPGEVPIFTCIVPTAWLSKNLPIMGGDVAYIDQQSSQEILTDYIFLFSDGVVAEGTQTIMLDIHHKKWTAGIGHAATHSKLLDAPVTIHCRTIEEHAVNRDWCVEVILLNHFFGSCALSASMGNNYLDYGDVFTVIQMSSVFDFEFGRGDSPTDIIPTIQQCVQPTRYKSVFLMLCGKSGKVRMAHLDEAVKALDYNEATTLITDVAVDQDKMLISVLLGRCNI